MDRPHRPHRAPEDAQTMSFGIPFLPAESSQLGS